ncbi:hypothetical protein ACJX0J_000788 [Zea mays]
MTATIFSILRIPILFEKKKKKEDILVFFLQFFFLEILEKFSFKTDSCFTEEKREFRLFHINGSTFMFLLHEYDIFWTFLIIESLIPILVFWISGLLAPVSEGPEKLSSYESGIEPMGGAWLQFRNTLLHSFLYPWAMSFDVLGVSVFIEGIHFCAYPSCCGLTLNTDSYSTVRGVDNELGGVLLCRKRKKRAVTIFQTLHLDQDNAAGDFTNKSGDWDSIAVILYSLPKRIILESRLFSGDNKFMFTYTTQFQILFKGFISIFQFGKSHICFPSKNKKKYILRNSGYTKLIRNCLEIYLLTLEIYLLTLRLKTNKVFASIFLADTLL